MPPRKCPGCPVIGAHGEEDLPSGGSIHLKIVFIWPVRPGGHTAIPYSFICFIAMTVLISQCLLYLSQKPLSPHCRCVFLQRPIGHLLYFYSLYTQMFR